MKYLFLTTVCMLALSASGCSMCSPGFLDDYATVGGKWQRSDPTQGRVGSIFSDPGSSISDAQVIEDGQYYSDGSYYPDDYNQGYSEEYSPDEGYYPEESEFYEEGFEGEVDEAYPDGHDVIILGDQW